MLIFQKKISDAIRIYLLLVLKKRRVKLMTNANSDYDIRLKRMTDAIALKEPDMVPMVPFTDGLPYFLYPEIGASHKSPLYDYDKAIEAHVKFHEEFEPDCNVAMSLFFSGKGAELLQPTMIDWPGRPGTPVRDDSFYQTLEIEYLYENEYDEFLNDYTGYTINKFLPRAFKGLKGLENFKINPCLAFSTFPLEPMANPDTIQALKNLVEYAELHAEVEAAKGKLTGILMEKGFAPLVTGGGEVPFDVLSDYFRGTTGTLMDQAIQPEKIEAVVDKLVDIIIPQWDYFKIPELELPVRRVFFPMHKGMDGFMSDEQYRDLYWRPFQKILEYLISIDVTPFLYTEGRYATRTDFLASKLAELPPGKVIVHFEEVGDFAEVKKKFNGIACVMGGMSYYLLEHGTPEQVSDLTKHLIDECVPGGGYLMDSGMSLEGVKRENMEAWFETARTYGKK